MFKYILRRIFLVIPVMLGVSFLVFTMIHFTPGDPVTTILGETASQESIDQLREELGLNDPFLVQYFRYVRNIVVDQDLGRSYVTRRSVTNEIISRYPNTLRLALLGVIVSVSIGVPLGIISAVKQYSWIDNIAMFFALIGVSMPIFWQGILLIILFSVVLRVLPSSGFNTWQQMILPALTLGTGSAAIVARMTRSSMLEVYRQDYIRTARSKGLREFSVVVKHALRNTLIPVVTIVGLQFGFLLGGAIVTETIFSIPGVGRLMVDAIRQRDMLIVQGGVLVIAFTFSIINLVVDVTYAFLDPKIRAQYK
ncbi:MAG: ABC transporter permease [Erysipelotrichia bacterium]|jgi:peptide/nickel transport system permease protein|nr:ABC transporter permease [Erysipelotrichia bacterium]